MQMLAPARRRFVSRFTHGFIIYWALNGLLLLEEARWHLLYRLTIWDIAQIRTLGLMIAHVHHPRVLP